MPAQTKDAVGLNPVNPNIHVDTGMANSQLALAGMSGICLVGAEVPLKIELNAA